MLVFEIEYLSGVSVAASPNHREIPEWPPHPDRLFQALVAAWGRNDPPDIDERNALEWLESIPKENLTISAPRGWSRDVVTVFVPPNDVETKGKVGDKIPKKLGETIRTIPELRKNRQPRAFPAVTIPFGESGILHYGWPLKGSHKDQLNNHKPALTRLAKEVTYIGHSHSLVRVVLVDALPKTINTDWMEGARATLRVPYPGRFKELQDAYTRCFDSHQIIRPRPSLASQTLVAQRPASSTTHFDADNITVFADAGGFVPTLAAFPAAAKRMRDALLHCTPPGFNIPTLLSGHELDGTPTAAPHLAIIPFADVGWSYSSGRLMGMGLVWPYDVSIEDRRNVMHSLAVFLSKGDGLLHFGRSGSWHLTLTPESSLASLRSPRYVRKALRWGTVLPMALDRHPKRKPGESLTDIIAQACLNIGISPETVDGMNVELHEHSPIKSGPSVKEVSSSLPKNSPYRGKPLVHLAITFAHPVGGPLLLGAGRFRGLGLCLPLAGGQKDA